MKRALLLIAVVAALVLAFVAVRTANIAKQQSDVYLRDRQEAQALVAVCDTLATDLAAYAHENGEYPANPSDPQLTEGWSFTLWREHDLPEKYTLTQGLNIRFVPNEINIARNDDGSCTIIALGKYQQVVDHRTLPPPEQYKAEAPKTSPRTFEGTGNSDKSGQ